MLTGCRSPGSGLDGCLYWMDGVAAGWNQAQWHEQVAFMREAGFRYVLVYGPAYDILLDEAGPSIAACDRLMAACEDADLKVYLSLWSHPNWFGRWDIAEELETNRKVLSRMADRYGGRASLAGWYIPHEIYVVWDDQADYIVSLYGGLSNLSKETTPDKAVILSPFFILEDLVK